MNEADVSIINITGSNPNVTLELGYAPGANEPGFAVVQRDAVESLSADSGSRLRTLIDIL